MRRSVPIQARRALTSLLAVASVSAAASLGGCGNEDALTRYAPAARAFAPLANARLRTGGGDAVALPLGSASLTGQINTSAKLGCTAGLTVETAAKDGTCALRLSFSPRTSGPGLNLTAATLVGRDAAGTCAPLAGQLPAGTGAVTYTLTGGTAWLPWAEPESSDAADGSLGMDKVLFELRGEAILTASGPDTGKNPGEKRTLTLFDRGLQLGGDIQLTANTSATCAPCMSDACTSPYPQFRLRETQPKNVAHNLAYTLDRWLGQIVVVTLTQGW